MRNDSSQSPLLTLPRLWALVALAGILIAANLVQVYPSDFWWHVRAGQWIVAHRQIPTTDLFSFTRAGEAWACQSWLMEVILFLALRACDPRNSCHGLHGLSGNRSDKSVKSV